MIETVIIDDEPIAILELQNLLADFKEISIIGTANNAADGLRLLKRLEPDLVFLDVNLPEFTGFELLSKLDYTPEIVFISSYNTYAIDAFKVNAIDYLLKPFETDRVNDSITRIKKRLNKEEQNPDKLAYSRKIFVKDGDDFHFIPLDKIRLIESYGNYSKIYYNDKMALLLKSLNHLEEKLPSNHFFRANRKYIINLDYIKNIKAGESHTIQVTLSNNEEIEISQRQSIKFKQNLGI